MPLLLYWGLFLFLRFLRRRLTVLFRKGLKRKDRWTCQHVRLARCPGEIKEAGKGELYQLHFPAFFMTIGGPAKEKSLLSAVFDLCCDNSSGLAQITVFGFADRGDHGTSVGTALYKFYRGLDFGKHGIVSEMSCLHIGLCFLGSNRREILFRVRTVVYGNFFHTGEDQQFVGV